MIHNTANFSHENDDFRKFIKENNNNLDLITSRLMLNLGFRLNLRGVTYLREAIKCCFEHSDATKICFGRDVYPTIAQKFGTDARNVERNVRTAIKTCYNDCGLFRFNVLCGCEMISSAFVPTNSEFVMNVATYLKTEMLSRM